MLIYIEVELVNKVNTMMVLNVKVYQVLVLNTIIV